MEAIKKNLKEANTQLMYCLYCFAEYSATDGDYWDRPDDHEFKYCGEIMILGKMSRGIYTSIIREGR